MAKASKKKAGKNKSAKEEEVKAKAASEASSEDESSEEESGGEASDEKESSEKESSEEESSEEESSEEESSEESEATSDPGKEAEAHAPKAAAKSGGDHGHAAAHANPHDHKPNRKEYWVIFGVLFALTVLEVVVAQVPGIAKTSLVLALVMLALVKAACVALFYMHLKHETRVLKLTVAIPLAMPAIYAIVLIAEATWRML